MAWAHGKETIITVDGDTIVGCNTSEMTDEADEEDMTCYGDANGVVAASTKRGGWTLGGKYVVGATGPAAVLQPLVGGANVAFVGKPEGTGTGKPNYAASVHVKKYVQTQPAAGYITWSAELTRSGALTITSQA
jgi:flavin-dependent dehydrogenase